MKSFIIILILILEIDSFFTLEDNLEIKTTSLGAELTSIIYKGKEYLHDGKTVWDQQSPILFPIVGKLRYDKTRINGKNYTIPKHGFAMKMEFEKIGQHEYRLKSNDKTLEQFPFI